MIPLLCIIGPTASGKTALGVELAKRFNGEIVSADSMQVYRGIHIASAAPDEAEKAGIHHHLIEFLPLSAHFTVADYVRLADEVIAQIHNRGKLPIVVGGTGLYIDALTNGLQFVETPTDPVLRAELTRRYETLGGEEMLRRLAEFDPETAGRLHPNDGRRIVRAFEIYESVGKTATDVNAESYPETSKYQTLQIGLSCRDRAVLYDQIDRRVDRMMECGLPEEAAQTMALQTGGAAQAIGHKELYPALRGEITLCEAAEQLKQSTRRYAKRQLTWFRRNEQIRWIYTDETPDPVTVAAEWVTEWRKTL